MSVAGAVLLDLYDTLVTAPWSVLAEEWGLRLGIASQEMSRGFEVTRGIRSRRDFESVNAEIAAIVEACGITPDSALVNDLVAVKDEYLESQVVLFSDALATLRSLESASVATAIVSNCSRLTADVVDRLGLRDAVDQVILSFEVGSAKPEPEIFQHALGLLAVDTGLFVDDQAPYLDGAAQIGLSTVQMMHPESQNPNPPIGKHETAKSLAEVKDRLDITDADRTL